MAEGGQTPEGQGQQYRQKQTTPEKPAGFGLNPEETKRQPTDFSNQSSAPQEGDKMTPLEVLNQVSGQAPESQEEQK